MKNILKISEFSNSQVAQFRIKVIEFHSKHGTSATIDAFGVGKTTIYRWKQQFKRSNRDVTILIPKSKRPHNIRSMQTDIKIIEEIVRIRSNPPILGKEKIKPQLDLFCDELGLKRISISTIGKIIKRKCPKIFSNGRVYHNPNDARAKKKVSYKRKVKKSPKILKPGYVEIDTIVRFILGVKIYIFNAVDVYSRFEFSYAYLSSSSDTARDFFTKLQLVYPFKEGIKVVQTDNGSEYMWKFDDYLKKEGIEHLYIYPRCPKINGYVERANRTLSEDFLRWNLELAAVSIKSFNEKLVDHLVWFNTLKPHSGLGNLSPVDYLLKNHPESHMYVTYTLF